MQGLRASLLGPNSSSLVDKLIVQYEVSEHLDISRLAEDREQMPALEMELTGVTRLQHLSLLCEQQEGRRGVSSTEMVEVDSTVENLVQVAGAVSIGQPVLLVGEAGVGKTSLVRELAGRTGKELLTLQVDISFKPLVKLSPTGQRQYRLAPLGWVVQVHRAARAICLGGRPSHQSSH